MISIRAAGHSSRREEAIAASHIAQTLICRTNRYPRMVDGAAGQASELFGVLLFDLLCHLLSLCQQFRIVRLFC